MINQYFIEFLKIKKVTEKSIIFESINKLHYFYSYFKSRSEYYLLIFGQNDLDLRSLDQSLIIIQRLTRRKRKLRSIRGFFIYALEIIKSGKSVQQFGIIETNLNYFFWDDIEEIVRKNQKSTLIKFLFKEKTKNQEKILDVQRTIKSLENRVQKLEKELTELK
jgi:hypothetical protein